MSKFKSSSILKAAFDRLKKQNPSISLRGLAIKIGVSHVFLSKVLSGKVPVPEARLKLIVKFFQLDPFAVKELKEYMVADLSPNKKIDRILQSARPSRKKKAVEVYEEQSIKHQVVLENWYELPILDYLTCEGVAKDIESIADSLSIKPSAVAAALKKMENAKFIQLNEDGEWEKVAKFLRFPAVTPSDILRKYYIDVLKRTASELSKSSQSDYDRRLIINFSIATSDDKIPEVKEKLSQFLYDLSVEMADGPANNVYHLTLGLVPLTNVRSDKQG